MAGLRSILNRISRSAEDRRGVSSAEYAVLAVGVVVVVAGALVAYDLNNPLAAVGSALLSAVPVPR